MQHGELGAICGLAKTHRISLSETDTTRLLRLETATALRTHGEDASKPSKSEAPPWGAGVVWQMDLSKAALCSVAKSKQFQANMHLAGDQF